jgi:3'(2'), 5'-bisphosphate nucleotidase
VKPLSVDISADMVDRVRSIALRAGEAILAIYNSEFAVEHKDDRSPVTEADRRAEALILRALRDEVTNAFPIVAEEEVAAGRTPEVDGGPFWLVDPLDGTKEFIRRRGEFTVNIALIESGRPKLGVVHAPAKQATYWGSPLGAFADIEGAGTQPIACRPMPARGLIAVASKSHRNPELEEYLSRYDLAESLSAGSSIKFCLVATGLADLYPRTGRTMEWDTAAGQAVVMYAGGSVTDMQGRELTYGKPEFENPHFVVRGAPSGS